MTLSESGKYFLTPARREAFRSLLGDKSCRRMSLTGLVGSAPAMFFAMVEGGKSPLLIIANDITEAGYIYNDIRNIAGEESVAVFPSGYKRDIKYGQVDPPSQMLRADVLERLRSSSRTLRCVVTCPEALAEKVAERKDLDDKTTFILIC